MHISQPRLLALQAQLNTVSVDVYLQPMADEFQGEYTPDCAARLPWLTDFTGSAGLGAFWAAPHGQRRHTLFVDGRYTLQATQQVSADIQVCNSGEQPLGAWLRAQDAALTIGFDPWLVTHDQVVSWAQADTRHRWVGLAPNPVDAIWAERPAPPAGEVVLQPEALAGMPASEKHAALLAQLGEAGVDGAIFTLPDGINWLLNIRGNDIPFNPLMLSYLILKTDGSSKLYTYERTYVQDVQAYFSGLGVMLAPLADLWAGNMPLAPAGARLWIDPSVAAEGFWQLAAGQGITLVPQADPTLLPKACKNTTELAGIRAAHQRDGLALSRFLCWLDQQIEAGKLPDELTVVATLERFRSESPDYRQPSFATIAGAGPNGAIVHYRADTQSNRRLKKGELLLLDSGGQYADGTTDVTRTVAIGEPTGPMKEHYTRVLKGHIALVTARFPEGTTGPQLDVLARQFLWQAGLDYDHGTGHGVGAYLCVHEGPARIAKRGSSVALAPGMVLSNEPGYYAAGKYGIRIENLVAVEVVGAAPHGKALLGFDTLTLAPIDTRLVDVAMLSSDERNWLNDYHRRVYKTHAAAMHGLEKEWLASATRAV